MEPIKWIVVGADVLRHPALLSNGAVEHPTESDTIDLSRMDAEPNDAARILIHDTSAPFRNCTSAIVLKPSTLLMKQRNPNWGCPRIAQHMALSFNIQIDKDALRRILAHHHRSGQDSGGPSWLTFLGHMKDSLWSMDLFRCESATLRTHWVLVELVASRVPSSRQEYGPTPRDWGIVAGRDSGAGVGV